VRRCYLILSAILGIHIGLLMWSAERNSPVFHEVPHLPAGLSHLLFGRFDLYRVNPPLPRMVAALPLLFLNPATDWSHYSTYPTIRSELQVATDFVNANGDACIRLFRVARLACIPFSVIGCIACFCWARDLYGSRSGLWAAILWCFSPFVLGHAPLVMPDAPSAAFCVTACYAFWKWLQVPSWPHALISGTLLGLALLTKTTLLILLPLWPFLWCASRVPVLRLRSAWLNEAAMLLGTMVAAVVVLNAGYCFDGTLKPLGGYAFVSNLLAKPVTPGAPARNCFAKTWLAPMPVPLPEQFLLGIDQQKADFEHPSPCYLRGVTQRGGWWYYYIYALVIKLPVGTMILLTMSLFCASSAKQWRNASDTFILFIVPITILALLSSQTALTSHSRYALPVVPFICVGASRMGTYLTRRCRLTSAIAVVALTWTCESTVFAFPHNIAYFNELVGGPLSGPSQLLDSNLAWGQDLLFLREWVSQHPQAKPMYTLVRPWIDPQLLGIRSTRPWLMPPPRTANIDWPPPIDLANRGDVPGPQPGWYVVDVNFVRGVELLALDDGGAVMAATQDQGNVSYLETLDPTARAGYSIYIYHLDAEAAMKVARSFGGASRDLTFDERLTFANPKR
jgi:hypothetical protein